MAKRVMMWMLGAVLMLSPVASGQWGAIESDEPYGLSYSHLSQLSQLLELDAPTHELLFELHQEMFQLEKSERQKLQDRIAELQEDEFADWSNYLEWSMDLEKRLIEISDSFFDDVRLMVEPDRFVLIEHMKCRSRMVTIFDAMGDDISGLAGSPFELLHEDDALSPARFRELVSLHADVERRNCAQFDRTLEAITGMQKEFMNIGFDFEDGNAQQMASIARKFMETIEQARRLRRTNEELADAIIASLTEEERPRFEGAWLELNYPEVQSPRTAERAVRMMLADETLDGSVREAVEEMRVAYDDRLRIARRMARVAKHRSDLDISFEMILNDGEPDRTAYDDSLRRIEGIAASYEAAVRGVLTREQRVKYGLEAADEEAD